MIADIYEYQGEIISTKTFVDRLTPHIKKGDTLSLEIDTMKLGKICTGLDKTHFLEAIFEIFYQLAGEGGNIIVPTFSYSWGLDSPKKYFDVRNTSGKVGIFPEYFRKRNDVIRTLDPMFSFAIWGKDKEWLSENLNKTSFGRGSLYEKIHKLNAKLVSFGLEKYDPTFVHYVEQYFHENIDELDYRFIKKFTGTIVNYEGLEYEDHQYCFSRYLDRTDLDFDETKMAHDLFNENKLTKVRIGNGDIYISDCESVFDIGINGLRRNKHYFMAKKGAKGCMDVI